MSKTYYFLKLFEISLELLVAKIYCFFDKSKEKHKFRANDIFNIYLHMYFTNLYRSKNTKTTTLRNHYIFHVEVHIVRPYEYLSQNKMARKIRVCPD